MNCVFVIASITVIILNVLNIDANHRSKRIVGGEPISISKIPWMAMLVDEKEVQFCGGTIISENAILTSNKCMYRRALGDVFVVIGVTKTDEIKPENRFSVKRYTPHPAYTRTKFQNDIAILVLNKNVDKTKYPRIKLAPPKKQTYENGCIAGWGYTSEFGSLSNELLEVCFTSEDFKNCSEHWSNMTNPEKQICVGAKGKDSCAGDGGAPLYTNHGGEVTQIGVISFGNPHCGDIDTVHTRVSEFVNWIKETITKL